MCGFLGAVFKRAVQESDVEAVRRATEVLTHRGPDSSGLHVVQQSRAVLGFRRLSIIDLAGGDQPMSLAGGQSIIFNGEIYNYRALRDELGTRNVVFQNRSDTEVLLQLLHRDGVDALDRVNGMFAFGYLDPTRSELVLARDRLGIKQLYYADTPDAFIFASEPKALVALPWVPRALNEERLADYFTFRCVPAPSTLFRGIEKLAPGTVLVRRLEHQEHQVRTFWSVPDPRRSRIGAMSGHQALRRFEEAFLEAVERRLVSDVPVGAFLSGGLDSSLVVAAIAKLGHPGFQTFSATFPGSPDDEAAFSHRVSVRFGAKNTQFPTRPDDFLAALPTWINLNDDLVADASSLPLYHVARTARAAGFIVMLSGEGSDELFAGYGSYHKFTMLNRVARLLPRRARARLADALVASGRLGRQDLPRVREYFVQRRGYLGTAALLDVESLQQLLPAAAVEDSGLLRAEGNGLVDLGAFDFARRIPDDLLVRTDRATMGASVEARVPFLDHELVNLVNDLAPAHRSRMALSKILLRRLALKWGVPRQTIYHRKIGFQLPIGDWFRGPLAPAWTEILERRAIPGINYDFLRTFVDLHLRSEASFEEFLWRMFSLEAWFARWVACEDLSTVQNIDQEAANRVSQLAS